MMMIRLRAAFALFCWAMTAALLVGAAVLLTGCTPSAPAAAPAPPVPSADGLAKLFAFVMADALDALGPAYLGQIDTQTRAAWGRCPEGDAACRTDATRAAEERSARTRQRLKGAIATQRVLAAEADALAACARGADCLAQHLGAARVALNDLRATLQALRAEICAAGQPCAFDLNPAPSAESLALALGGDGPARRALDLPP